MQGFIVTDYLDRIPEMTRDVAEYLKTGRIIVKETIFEGIDCAPEAFLALLKDGREFKYGLFNHNKDVQQDVLKAMDLKDFFTETPKEK